MLEVLFNNNIPSVTFISPVYSNPHWMWKLLNIEGLVYLEDSSLLVKDNDRLGEGVTEEDCNGVKSGATDLTPQDSGYQENGLTTVGLQVQATARKHCSVKKSPLDLVQITRHTLKVAWFSTPRQRARRSINHIYSGSEYGPSNTKLAKVHNLIGCMI